jgi:predicted Fe-Mo cluster-binding NifX family protein
MKILFAADDKTLESKIAKRFGHAKYYLIYDLDNDSFEAMVNPGHGEKHEILYELANKGIKTFIVGNIGPGAYETVEEVGAEVYLARLMTVKDALEKYKSGELEKLSKPTLKRSIEHH